MLVSPSPVLGPLKRGIPQSTEEKVLVKSKGYGPKCFCQAAMLMDLLYLKSNTLSYSALPLAVLPELS